MINRIKSLIKKVVGISTTEVECSIDEDIVDCQEIDNMPPWGHSDLEALRSYTPRPTDDNFDRVVDDWFAIPYNEEVDFVTGEPVPMDQITVEQVSYQPPSSEPENIHQVMYDIATKNGKHWEQGGSETFQENVNLDGHPWQSGTGWSLYR
tara:strand:+ start:39 stop:491 length:453 start_codon:yes stop_codon:yes gene_type:complete